MRITYNHQKKETGWHLERELGKHPDQPQKSLTFSDVYAVFQQMENIRSPTIGQNKSVFKCNVTRLIVEFHPE